MTTKIALLTVQKWGNSLAVRIPIVLARRAHFQIGTPVELALQEGNLIVRLAGEPKLTLDQRLKLFDPEKHGGEAMATGRVGMEKF